jgi:FlaA1/EpsC-like NDP-sugar epimerase
MIASKDLSINKVQLFGKFVSLRMTKLLLDLVILCAAFIFAYFLRFDFAPSEAIMTIALLQMLFIVPLEMGILHLYGINRFIWRYMSLRETECIVSALFVTMLPLAALRFTLPNAYIIPISIILLNFFLASIGLLTVRMLRREFYEANQRMKKSVSAEKAVLLVGAGRAGVMTLSDIKSNGDINLKVVGFIDDDPFKQGAVINGVKVLGTTAQLPEIVKNFAIDHIIISIARASRQDFQRILSVCRSIPIRVRTIPTLFELLQDKVRVSRIRDIEIEDLLGRSPVELEKNSIETFLQNKIVMVTGAGGSIGSELVRQLIRCQPKKLVLVERSEFALFQIEREIAENFPEVDFVPVIGDIGDCERMTKIFRKLKPQVVFHAAAHKHVPMMELNASEALKNNVLGTHALAQLAGEHETEVFVLISTDKAVNPTSIMGASKRLAELVIQDFNSRYDTRFVAVRFGNVIGSNGSVIPTFREQIKKGGPVTVTHPQMQRFFMTIPEATQLVLQAGAIGKGGEIFILDMGEPVRILDLAAETIKLSGLKPGVDIQIIFTGMRPGEKLTEELGTGIEEIAKTIHPKIFIGKIKPYPKAKIKMMLDQVQALSLSEDGEKIRCFLSDFLPESQLRPIENKTAKTKQYVAA